MKQLIFIASICCAIQVMAQVHDIQQFKIRAVNVIPNGNSQAQELTVGVADSATNGQDTLRDKNGETLIRERIIPPFIVIGAFVLAGRPPMQEDWFWPFDMRQRLLDSAYRVDYQLIATWNAGSLIWNLASVLPKEVDSAILVDDYSTYPNNFQRWKVVEGQQFEIINTALSEFRLIVFYNSKSTSIQEYANTNFLWPNPTANNVHVHGKYPKSSILIYNALGQLCFETSTEQYPITIPLNLQSGAYNVVEQVESRVVNHQHLHVIK
jgi:hypothetical protein